MLTTLFVQWSLAVGLIVINLYIKTWVFYAHPWGEGEGAGHMSVFVLWDHIRLSSAEKVILFVLADPHRPEFLQVFGLIPVDRTQFSVAFFLLRYPVKVKSLNTPYFFTFFSLQNIIEGFKIMIKTT